MQNNKKNTFLLIVINYFFYFSKKEEIKKDFLEKNELCQGYFEKEYNNDK